VANFSLEFRGTLICLLKEGCVNRCVGMIKLLLVVVVRETKYCLLSPTIFCYEKNDAIW
jgi:hypothetical protein